MHHHDNVHDPNFSMTSLGPGGVNPSETKVPPRIVSNSDNRVQDPNTCLDIKGWTCLSFEFYIKITIPWLGFIYLFYYRHLFGFAIFETIWMNEMLTARLWPTEYRRGIVVEWSRYQLSIDHKNWPGKPQSLDRKIRKTLKFGQEPLKNSARW